MKIGFFRSNALFSRECHSTNLAFLFIICQESAYWKRIQKQRREKRDKTVTIVSSTDIKKRKVRGRERHRTRAEVMKNSHTYFGDGDDDA